jgi:hypothetical protein
MERGVVVGGLLISGSFLLAVLLNHSAKAPVGPEGGVAPAERMQDLAQAPTDRGPLGLADCCRPDDKECPPKTEALGHEDPCKVPRSSPEADSR